MYISIDILMLNDLSIKNLINNYDVINRFRREVRLQEEFQL